MEMTTRVRGVVEKGGVSLFAVMLRGVMGGVLAMGFVGVGLGQTAGGTALPGTALPGTVLLREEGDLASLQVAGIDAYLNERWAELAASRGEAGTAEELAEILGVSLTQGGGMRGLPTLAEVAPLVDVPVARPMGGGWEQVRWLAAPGFAGSHLYGEGFLRKPGKGGRACLTISIPEAGESPEAHVRSGVPAALQAGGCRLLVMPLVNLGHEHSGKPGVRRTTLPHREYLWRMGFPIGKHVLGLEVEKLARAIAEYAGEGEPVHVEGRGEGALVAQYAAMLLPRITTVGLPEEGAGIRPVWNEPIYRSIWKLYPRFTDGAIRRRLGGRVVALTAARKEAERGGVGAGEQAFLQAVAAGETARVARQMHEAVQYLQAQIRQAEAVRNAEWRPRMAVRLAEWQARKGEWQREFVASQGELAVERSRPPEAESRLVQSTTGYTTYAVRIPVLGSVFASGLLLVPKQMAAGERRPMVVVQHGLESRDRDMVNPESEQQQKTYRRLGALLAERGFVVYCPQNPYLFGERFRVLSRKGFPLGLTLYSFITAQHRRTVDWLERLPFVDAGRMAYYGLSYGGRTAMMTASVEERYRAVVCSGNFNEWLWKVTTEEQPFSYLFTQEHEIFEWKTGLRWGHAELALLMAPRAFYVERGHQDGVGIDEWVSYEYAKVRRQYKVWQIPEQTGIEYFEGPHQIYADGAVDFLHRQLRYP